MFNIFKKKKSVASGRFVTCYLVCNRDDVTTYIREHIIREITGRKTFFLQEQHARNFIKEKNDKRLVIMELQVPEEQITFFPMNDSTCECNSDINMITCYKRTIYP